MSACANYTITRGDTMICDTIRELRERAGVSQAGEESRRNAVGGQCVGNGAVDPDDAVRRRAGTVFPGISGLYAGP